MWTGNHTIGKDPVSKTSSFINFFFLAAVSELYTLSLEQYTFLPCILGGMSELK